MNIDVEILRCLLHNDEYFSKTIPHIKKEYFQNQAEKILFELIHKHHVKYHGTPSIEAMTVMLEDSKVNEKVYADCIDLLADVKEKPEKVNVEWMHNRTEDWAKDRALHHAMLKAIEIFDSTKDEPNLQRTAIPDLFKDALSIQFKSELGMGYFRDIEKQWDYYQKSEDDSLKLKFDIDVLNKVTRNGVPRRTLNICFAGVNVGKTAYLCYLSGMYLQQSLNVLFISCEMQESLIRERIDANILGLPTDQFYKIKQDMYVNRLKRIKEQTTGEMFIKDYPPLRSNSLTYQKLLDELKIKENFIPDVILIDYIGIVASSNMPVSAMQNSNLYMGQVSKELRALAVENNCVLWTAHQLNREGMKEIEIEMTHSGGSIDITKDADFIIALSQPEEMEKQNQIIVKQLKNRYNKKSRSKRFILGYDTDLMRFYSVENSEQEKLYENITNKKMKNPDAIVDTPEPKKPTKKVDASDWKL
jgi:replicative DNA helicase